ncbi:MAG TPA: sigma-54 dependent transcriptional regulator [Candidatus Polarisedimenticolaceae bacterium]|nr:sigma-54 dependent transcriptional regulator [Candidatus Polarisedimenticolaceae bacterium]
MTPSNQRPGSPEATRENVEHVLQLALDTTGAERAFFVRGRPAGDGSLDPVVFAWRTRADDGVPHPSRSLARAALTRREAFLSLDAQAGDAWSEAASVRAMALRFVLVAPLPVRCGCRSALVLDSRSAPRASPRPELIRSAVLCARLIDQLTEAATPSLVSAGEADGPRLVGRSRPIRETWTWIERAARTQLPVLILGETGSGKEGVARRIHDGGPRRAAPFVAFNCAALPDSLIEAELFGSVRGAYTGAERDRRGLFALADGGTLLLDELGDMPASMQAKLLRALEEGRVRPIGADRDVAVDVRIVGATHHDLAQRVRDGAFRADLYHRLAVIEIRVPPLRERIDDLPLLIESLAPRLERETGRALPPLGRASLDILGRHSWPGNVRELHAVLARALLRADGAPIDPRHLAELCRQARTLDNANDGSERAMIAAALANTDGSVGAAARRIGWTRQKLYRRINALALDRLL